MRPVDRQPLAMRAAEQRRDGDAEILGLDVVERVLEGGDGLGRQTTGHRTGDRAQGRDDLFDRTRVLADDQGYQTVNDPGQPGTAETFQILRISDETGIRDDLQEVQITPSGAAMQVFNGFNLHFARSYGLGPGGLGPGGLGTGRILRWRSRQDGRRVVYCAVKHPPLSSVACVPGGFPENPSENADLVAIRAWRSGRASGRHGAWPLRLFADDSGVDPVRGAGRGRGGLCRGA